MGFFSRRSFGCSGRLVQWRQIFGRGFGKLSKFFLRRARYYRLLWTHQPGKHFGSINPSWLRGSHTCTAITLWGRPADIQRHCKKMLSYSICRRRRSRDIHSTWGSRQPGANQSIHRVVW